jgi:phosphocarrier protein
VTGAQPLRREMTIRNRRGLHARASARFVETVERFDARATVEKDGMRVDGRSIMGLLMLAAAQGSTIAVETAGPDAEALMTALDALVADLFGEGG